MRLYQVIGRKAPTETDENPPAYRMKIFAANEINAQSRFWYFMHQIRKMKKTTGEILDVNEVITIYITSLFDNAHFLIMFMYMFYVTDHREEHQICQELRHLDQVQL